MASVFPQATAAQISLRDTYFAFSNSLAPFFLGKKEYGTTAGYTSVEVEEIGVRDQNGECHCYAHVIHRLDLRNLGHSADEDPDDPLMHYTSRLQVPNDVWASISSSMPAHFKGVVPDQGVFYFKATQMPISGDIRSLLSGQSQVVYTANHFAVTWLRPDADDPSVKEPSMRFKTPESPFEIWTHGSRRQVLYATIQKVTTSLNSLPLGERALLQQRLTILQGAEQIENAYETAQKRLAAQEKKLIDAHTRFNLNPTDANEIRRFANDSKNISQQIQKFQGILAKTEQDLMNYKAANKESLPHSYYEATLQAGFTINYGSFLHTKRLATNGNVLSTGLTALPPTREEADLLAKVREENSVHKPY